MSNNASEPLFYNLSFYHEHLMFAKIIQPTWPILICVGLISNTINVVVFLKAGVKDSVTTLLLTLSISDAMFLIFIIPSVVVYNYLTPTTVQVHLMCYWPAMTFYDYSSYISVFLGVTRCACVVKPLHFKSVFTKSRTVIAVCILFCVDVLLHIPVLSISRLGWKKDPETNNSYLSVVSDNNSLKLKKMRINDVVNKNFIAWTSFIVMIVCAALLSFKLFESSKIRSIFTGTTFSSSVVSSNQPRAPKQKLSPKDVRVVQSVVLVCVIFIVAQIPSIGHSVARVALEEFTAYGNLLWVGNIVIKTSLTCYMANASLNILVYYNYNSNYRAVLRSILTMKDTEMTPEK